MVPHYIHSLLPTAMLVFLPAAARAWFVPTDLAAFFIRRIVPVGLQVAEVVHVPVVQVLAHTGSAFSNTCYSYALSLSQSVSASYKNDSVLIYILQLLNKILTYLLSS